MIQVFADTNYWVAILYDLDQSHQAAMRWAGLLQDSRIVTTEEVMTEVLNFFGVKGPYLRRLAGEFLEGLRDDPSVVILEQTHRSFLDGFELFRSRSDKGFSLTDCISMATMHQLGIVQVLTHDQHFSQEGFERLL